MITIFVIMGSIGAAYRAAIWLDKKGYMQGVDHA